MALPSSKLRKKNQNKFLISWKKIRTVYFFRENDFKEIDFTENYSYVHIFLRENDFLQKYRTYIFPYELRPNSVDTNAETYCHSKKY